MKLCKIQIFLFSCSVILYFRIKYRNMIYFVQTKWILPTMVFVNLFTLVGRTGTICDLKLRTCITSTLILFWSKVTIWDKFIILNRKERSVNKNFTCEWDVTTTDVNQENEVKSHFVDILRDLKVYRVLDIIRVFYLLNISPIVTRKSLHTQ